MLRYLYTSLFVRFLYRASSASIEYKDLSPCSHLRNFSSASTLSTVRIAMSERRDRRCIWMRFRITRAARTGASEIGFMCLFV